MPELAILEQTVLTGLIEKYTAPPENVASALFGRRTHPFTTAKWDVVQNTRYRGHPTMPNREAKIVGQQGVGTKTASFIYYREKKAFEPTTLRWLREPGQLAANNAESCIRRETQDLNNRLERLVDSYCWDTLKDSIVIDEPDVKATVTMGIQASHKPTATVKWDHITSVEYDGDVIGDVKAWKKLIAEDSGNPATDIYLDSTTMEYVYKNKALKALFTERVKQEYLDTGNITGLLGLNWHVYDGGYVNDSGTFVPHITLKYIFMLAKAAETFVLLEGLSADEDAPANHTGKFSKSWITKDPSATFFLLEYNFIPVLLHPDNVIYALVLA